MPGGEFPIFGGVRARKSQVCQVQTRMLRGKIRGSGMNEGLQQRSGDRQADVAAAGPADTAALPDCARFGGVVRTKGEFPVEGKLGWRFPIRLETRNGGRCWEARGGGKVCGYLPQFAGKKSFRVAEIFRFRGTLVARRDDRRTGSRKGGVTARLKEGR